MRTALSVAVVAALAISLSACSASTESEPTSTPTDSAASTDETCATNGTTSDAVSVTGDFGAKPIVTFAAPLSVDTTERTEVITGTGDPVTFDSTVKVDFTLYNGTSGEEVADVATPYDGENTAELSASTTETLVGLARTIACSTVGSRVVGVIPPAESWNSAGQTDLGIAATDAVVFVVDIESIVEPVVPEAYSDMTDMPTVVFGDDGIPTVTMPEGVEPPTTTRVGIIEEGDGDVVQSGDSVTVNYHGVLWDDGSVFDSSYERGEPATFTTTGVVPGFQAALEGVKVGSKVISVVTPDDGYGATGSGSIPANATLVFVLEIISIN